MFSTKSKDFGEIVDVGLGSHGLFVAIKTDGIAHAFRASTDALSSIWEFTNSVGHTLSFRAEPFS